MAWRSVTILCGNGPETKLANWDVTSPLIVVEPDLLWQVISVIEAEGTDEVNRIIFGSSVPFGTFLSVVASLHQNFRGDVVICTKEWGAYLSSVVASGPGRILYELSQNDLAFYLRVNFGGRPGVERKSQVSELSRAA